ncbi:MAG: PqqD family peptide modification chaperone [Candidatus Thermoplasmatota archaeon]|nr:PqqD family peptide modification chaperone [Candidatus Thermoplasmatota archaeon]
MVQFEVTIQCNNSCRFCYNFRRTKSKEKIQSKSSVIEKKRILKELASLGVYSIVFTGGEPFTYSNLIDLLKYAKQLGFVVYINSNGTLITKKISHLLKEINIDGVMISLHAACSEIHDSQTNKNGSWKNTINGIQNLLEQKVHTGINMTVTNNNYEYVYDLGKYSVELGVPFSITRFIPINKRDTPLELSYQNFKKVLIDIEKIKKLYSKKINILTPFPLCSTYKISKNFADARCTAGLTWCAISPNLDVRPCIFTSEIIGNLKYNKFIDIWNSKKMKRFQNLNNNSKECLDCEILQLCLGGCRQLIKVHKKDPLMMGMVKFKDISIKDQEMAKIKLKNIYSKNPRVVLRSEEFGATLILSQNKYVFLKGQSSIFIWNLIDGKRDLEKIAYNLINKYNISIIKAKKDVIEFFTELYIHELIKEEN